MRSTNLHRFRQLLHGMLATPECDDAVFVLERILWLCTIVWGGCIFWIADRPPMIDLPSHVAQVALLRDLILGVSPWADVVRINLQTPYLLGYGISCLLSLCMPVVVAIKLVLTIGYLGYVVASVALRKHYGSSHVLDWIPLSVFFGFAYKWGFFTYLMAAPVGLLYVLLFDIWLGSRNRKYGCFSGLVGVLLLLSHGLMFVFFWAIALAMALRANYSDVRRLVVSCFPLVVNLAACLILAWLAKRNEEAFGNDVLSVSGLGYYDYIKRVAAFLVFPFDNEFHAIYLLVSMSFVLAPFICGFRPQWVGRSTACVPFAVVLCTFALVPTTILATAFVYERFSLFVFLFYALIFSGSAERRVGRNRQAMGVSVLIVASWLALGVRTIEAVRFDEESAGFSDLLEAMAPGQRALYLPIDRNSKADGHDDIYLHFASWYQAERHGFVDFNFANFPPQIVRFRNEQRPKVQPGFEWRPMAFNWVKHEGERYRYFIVRNLSGIVQDSYFRGAPCRPRKLWVKGEWQLFERNECTSQ